MLAKDCLEEFALECELRGLTKRTTKGYYNNTKLFLTYWERKAKVYELEELKPLHIKQYMQYQMKKGLSASYINGTLKCLRAFFKFAVHEDYLDTSPAQKVNWQKEGKVIIKTFSDDEARALIEAFDYSSYLSARNRLVMAIAFDTGARNTEICSILKSDIRGNMILIHGKGNKERYVPITPYLQKTMMKYERLRDYYFEDKLLPTEHYLLSRTGKPLTKEAVERIFSQANEKVKVRSEIRCSPHTARHYYAQANLRNGLDVYSLSRLLGHENINITKRYLQSLQDESVIELALKTSPIAGLKISKTTKKS